MYDLQFDNLGPQDGRLSEVTVRNEMKMISDLFDSTMDLPDSFSTMDKIWELADQDQDGFLDRYEFIVASHLTRRACCYGDEIPDQVIISDISFDSIILLYIAASPSVVQRIPGQHQLLEGVINSNIQLIPTN